jgi:hypothetical protein
MTRLLKRLGWALAFAVGCSLLERGPSDEEVVAAVRATPPLPPTLGPTYLASVESVRVEERGRRNDEGHYWPVRVRIKGAAQVDAHTATLLAPLADLRKSPPSPVEFVEEARLAKDDFGKWQVTYRYPEDGPLWRRSAPYGR